MTFYKDTLIRIDCDQNVKIDIGFVQKYGSGRVKEETIWDTPFGQTDKRPNENFIENGKAVILSIHNEKIWQNQKLKATSYIHISYKYKDKKYLGVDYSIRNFSIVSKDESKNNEMLKCDSINQSLYKTHRELKNKENLNKL